ncbi:hypothetical protein J437_LFUL003205 [Ladona fulva]|uniref:Uncharacterized protein n=1 Tax=Ladona fulva TaxID=123851 RepID=A0A8K0NWQ1_LADFU|nr:hypothetical protein J437_LFUL003205 [Ladona fulva]
MTSINRLETHLMIVIDYTYYGGTQLYLLVQVNAVGAFCILIHFLLRYPKMNEPLLNNQVHSLGESFYYKEGGRRFWLPM